MINIEVNGELKKYDGLTEEQVKELIKKKNNLRRKGYTEQEIENILEQEG